jgi:hypothetical protein
VQGYQHLMLQPSCLIRKVNVTVDQPGEHGGPAEVDDPRSSRNRDIGGGTDSRDSLPLDEYHLIR